MGVGVLLNVPVRTKNDLEVKKREKKSYFFDFLSIFSEKNWSLKKLRFPEFREYTLFTFSGGIRHDWQLAWLRMRHVFHKA